MPKINIKVEIKNEEDHISSTTTGIINDERLKYKEEDETTVTFDYEKNILVRENEEWKMIYPFHINEKTKGIIEMKKMDRSIHLELETEKIERKNHDIKIHYLIEGNKYLYQIEEIK